MTNQTREQRKMLYERLIGTRIAEKFRITGLLGFGGMGAVYEAVQAPMERKVALKLIPSSDPTAAARFEREAYTISKLSHPNTVTLYDFGQANDGYLYLAMEYLEGKTLTDEIRQHGPLGAERAVHIANQICRSLGEAHRTGIIHRDVKPDNMFLISVDGDADYVKVLDFGIAKAVAGEEDVSLTADGRIIGTPRYMSPEQILAQPVDHRADIYSLGCIVFEMLCGGPPFEQNSTAALMMSHAQQSPPSFSERLTEAQLQAIPHGLENVVRRAMAKNPAQRPQTTDELRKELDQALRIHSAYATGGMPHVGGATGERPFYPTPTGSFGPPSGSYPPPGQHPTGQHQPSGYTGNYTGQHTGQHTGQRPQPQFPGQNPTGNFEHHTGDHPRQTGNYPRPQDSGSHTGQQATPTNKGKAALLVVVAVLLGLMGLVGYKISQNEAQTPTTAPAALAGAEQLKGAAPDTKPAEEPAIKEEPAPAEPKADDKEGADVVKVVIRSEPDKASIFMNGVRLGQTPYTVPVPKNGGIATYALRMEGYEDSAVAINPLDELRDLHVKLDREKKRPAYTGRKPDDKPEKKPDAVVTPPPEEKPPEVKKAKVEMIDDEPKTKVKLLD